MATPRIVIITPDEIRELSNATTNIVTMIILISILADKISPPMLTLQPYHPGVKGVDSKKLVGRSKAYF
jgi:hypothetical protein